MNAGIVVIAVVLFLFLLTRELHYRRLHRNLRRHSVRTYFKKEGKS